MIGTQCTGAEALIGTLADGGIKVCFANPGTSEMHLVQALDREPRVRSVLCLFEGVATGAADGYARISRQPALTLLHLGPGLANGLSHIHNAKKAFTPMVNVVGDHASYHRSLNAPLASDIATLAKPSSVWVGTAERPEEAGSTAASAMARAIEPPGGPVILIMTADSAWSQGGAVVEVDAPPEQVTAQRQVIDEIRDDLKASRAPMILVNGPALQDPAALAAMATLHANGIRIMTDTVFPVQLRGRGHFMPERMQYFAEHVVTDLEQADLLILAGTDAPVAFFAYPGKPSHLTPRGAKVMTLADRATDASTALQELAEMFGRPSQEEPRADTHFEECAGPLTLEACAASIARHLPANAIICDEGVTSAPPIFELTARSKSHRWLCLTGGALGEGLPMAVGASIADPAAHVVALIGDGAAMYSLQALWTVAREQLPILTVIFANEVYKILEIEMERTGAGNVGEIARSMLEIGRPSLDWVKLAEAQGVSAIRCDSAEQFDQAVSAAFESRKPLLIEARI